MISAVLTCAGNGTRFGKNKIISLIKGKAVLVRTVEQFKKAKTIDEIIVVAKRHDFELYQNLLDQAKLKVKMVEGGEERIISAYNGVIAAKGEIIITHDGVRPLVSPDLIDKVALAVKKYKAVIAGVPTTTTIKHIQKNLTVKKSLLRTETWMSQTPQGFQKKLLLKAYKKAIDDKYFVPTDDSELVGRLGIKIKIMEGDQRNIKITFPLDLIIAEGLLETFKDET